VDFSADVFPRLLDDGQAVFGYVAEGYWEDVGTLDAYIKAHQDVLDAQVALDLPGFRLGDGIWLGEGSEIDPAPPSTGRPSSATTAGSRPAPAWPSTRCSGRTCASAADAFIERSVVHDNVYLGPGVRLRGAVVGRSSDLPRGPGSRRAWSSATSASSASTP
jgi:mannose-1-phosphate guanylyltransferase/phosphomannomutase